MYYSLRCHGTSSPSLTMLGRVKVLTHRPRLVFFNLAGDAGSTIHIFGTCSHDCYFKLPALRGGRLPTQAVGFCFRTTEWLRPACTTALHGCAELSRNFRS